MTHAATGAPQDDMRTATPVEIRFRSAMVAENGVVRLGDLVSEIVAPDDVRQTLVAIPLFPTPHMDRRYQSHEVIERLALRGVDVQLCRFTGAESILIQTSQDTRGSVAQVSYQANSNSIDDAHDAATTRLHDVVLDLLRERAFASGEWSVQVDLPREAAPWIAAPENRLSISGIASPWVGNHELTIRVTTTEATKMFQAAVQVASGSRAIVARVPFTAGQIVTADMIEFAPIQNRTDANDSITHPDDVIGKEVTRSVKAGDFVRAANIRRPLVVRRGDTVTLYAENGGLRVSTMAKALQDGAIDDVINVESLDRERQYVVRVSGPHEVGVMSSFGRRAPTENR